MANLIAIIPARTGSKRLPNKNFLSFNHGPTLVGLAIDIARKSSLFSDIYVTTDAILPISYRPLATCLYRPYPMHSDFTQTAAVVMDTLVTINYACGVFCVLNPTSPLRTAEQLKELWVYFQERDADCLMTYSKANPTHHDGLALFCKRDAFLATLDFYKIQNMIDFVHDWPSVDIDTREDFELAERMARESIVSWG